MLKQLRQTIITNLIVKFHNETPHLKLIEYKLKSLGINHVPLDHFALIDLPGFETGISQMSQIFSAIGYIVQGRDYLPDKQNEFLWLTEIDSKEHLATEVLPQVVVADFRLDEMPLNIKKIIEKYARLATPSPLVTIQKLAGHAYLNDFHAAKEMTQLILEYFQGRSWPAPNIQEFSEVNEFNPLLGWVLLFGRKPNHFTIAAHLLNHFNNLDDFLKLITDDIGLTLNNQGGIIKGSAESGVKQASSLGAIQPVKLDGGHIEVLSEFVEFIWRYPKVIHEVTPMYWHDYHVGFLAHNANHVIESLIKKAI